MDTGGLQSGAQGGGGGEGARAAHWLVQSQVAGDGRVWSGVTSLAALPGGALALHGVEDLVVDYGAIGAVQGHQHGLCPRGRAAGALVLHVLRVNGVQGFAGTFTL